MPRWAGDNGSATRLDKLLAEADISSADLARELRLDPSTITKYRNGTRIPDADALAYMIKRAGGSADEVLGIRPLSSVPSAATLRRHLAAIDAARKAIEDTTRDASELDSARKENERIQAAISDDPQALVVGAAMLNAGGVFRKRAKRGPGIKRG
jgi:transcriptional regulator with XRE-family HTH domain